MHKQNATPDGADGTSASTGGPMSNQDTDSLTCHTPTSDYRDLIAALRSWKLLVRCVAAGALREFTGHAEVIVPALAAALKDRSGIVRGAAAMSLGHFGRQAAPAVPTLIHCLTDRHPDVRWIAASTLGEMGEAAAAAAPALMVAVKGRDNRVRYEAEDALGKIGAPALPVLADALSDKDVTIRRFAVAAMVRVGDAAVPGLLTALNDPDKSVRSKAIRFLLRCRGAYKQVVPALAAALVNSNAAPCFEAICALGTIGAPAERAVPELIQVLSDSRNMMTTRSRAAESLGEIGTPPALVALALVDALRDSELDVRYHAAKALGQFDPPAELVIPALVAALKDFAAAKEAATALGRIGAPAVPYLVEALGDPLQSRALIKALAMVGTASTSALIESLNHPSPRNRWRAVVALKRVGGSAELLAPVLLDLLSNERYRSKAVGMLGRLGAVVVPVLRDALFHTNLEIRTDAARILVQISPHTLIGDAPGLVHTGIARLAGAFDLKAELTDFYRIGVLCLGEDEGVFSFRAMAAVLDRSVPVIRDRLEAVTEFFRGYFLQYGHPPERGPFAAAFDNDELAAEEDKVIERSERRRPRICEPVGRWAWELSRDFLNRIHALPEDKCERS